jgi:hypothetical protein
VMNSEIELLQNKVGKKEFETRAQVRVDSLMK